MNCQQLTQTGDHIAWQQRVRKEAANERRFAEKASYTPVVTKVRSTNNFWLQTAPSGSLVKKS